GLQVAGQRGPIVDLLQALAGVGVDRPGDDGEGAAGQEGGQHPLAAGDGGQSATVEGAGDGAQDRALAGDQGGKAVAGEAGDDVGTGVEHRPRPAAQDRSYGLEP